MKKRVFIMLIMIASIIGAFAYHSNSKEPIQKTIVIDKNGKVVEPLSGDNDNLGH